MSLCDITWLDLCQRLRDVYLCEHQRGYIPLQLLPRPESQRPQLITMLGDSTKSSFLKKCFSLVSKRHKKIVLRSVPSHFASDAPLFVIDCELHNSLAPSALVTTAGGIELHSLRWLQNIPREMGSVTLAHLVYTRLLLPFSTVVCIFASDFDGTDKVAKFLVSWLKLRKLQPAFPSSTFPRILILVECSDRGSFDEKLATTKFLKRLRRIIREDKGLLGPLGDEGLTDVEFEKFLKENVFELRLLALPAAGDETYFDTFRTRLLCESEEIHNFRKVAKIAFSARHLQTFFQFACRHFADTIISPLDIVRVSRIPNPTPADLPLHLANFVECIPDEHHDIVAPVIASALYLDNFPPGAHIFDSGLVFETLYSKILEAGLRTLPNHQEVIQNIKADFCNKDYTNTAWLHKQLLKCFSDVWRITFSNSTCLSCLARAPSSVLPCKHSLCDTCVVIHGRSDLEEPWNFQFDSCPLCDVYTQTSILLKPSTAGIRCIVLDGGSYTDFEMLDTLEKELDLPMSIGEYFDMVNASGIGVWVILEKLCKNEQSSEDNLNYQNIRRNIQGPVEQSPLGSRFSSGGTLTGNEVGIALKRLEGAFKVFPRWSGTLQSSLKVLSSLNAIFGETTLFEFRHNSIKMCITVSRSKDSMICVLSNYNGDGTRQTSYKHVRERKIKNEVQLSQCARMSLSPKSVHGYHAKERDVPNEMIDIIRKEQDFIWRREGRAPDILVALGARVPSHDRTVIAEKIPDWLADFRLQATNQTALERSVDAILASLFYLELIGLPQLDELGQYFCRAQIRCRILPSSKAYRNLIERLRERRARFYYDYQSIPCINRQLYDEADRGIAFSRCIDMSLPTLQGSIDVKIDGITRTGHRISNCPYKIQQLVEDQGLHCVFGNKDHKMRYFGSIADLKSKPRLI